LPIVSDGNDPYYSRLALTDGMHNFTSRRFSRATLQFLWYVLCLTNGEEFVYG
jgi:hypothetical protein